jgi:erythromycin esterase
MIILSVRTSAGALARLLFAITVAVAGSAACGSSGSSTPANPPLDPHAPTAKADPAVAAWLQGEVMPFSSTDPAAGLDDLEPLRRLVGDARIVSLGEATHGTREFFRMKHRILRFLVERMGFTAFAIEATWPEANRLDDYVRTGNGDPAVLLSGLYFWTWNTHEVLDMIEWMRQYNAAGGNVGFYGFDMQYPGMAIDNVKGFIAAVDPPSSSDFTQHVACLAPYANDARGRFPTVGYEAQSAEYRDACRQDLQWVQDALDARRYWYEAASSHAQWARAEHGARVAIQWEEMTSKRQTRDAAMADNVKWLLDELPAEGKIVLWAHNGHVATDPNYGGVWSMGRWLRETYGSAMFVMGFDFARGSFNAVGWSGVSYTPLGPQTVGEPHDWSYEDYFLAAGMPLFILDVRSRTNWVAGPHLQRSIGSVFQLGYENVSRRDPQLYDAVIFIENSSASQLLPFNYPPTFVSGSSDAVLVSTPADALQGPAARTKESSPGAATARIK